MPELFNWEAHGYTRHPEHDRVIMGIKEICYVNKRGFPTWVDERVLGYQSDWPAYEVGDMQPPLPPQMVSHQTWLYCGCPHPMWEHKFKDGIGMTVCEYCGKPERPHGNVPQ
jgi:hypothetical protein